MLAKLKYQAKVDSIEESLAQRGSTTLIDIRGIPHDRQLAEIVGPHWCKALWPYHTGGTSGTGKVTWELPLLQVIYQGKAHGNATEPGLELHGPTLGACLSR
jgi:hypothetical protein